MLTVRRENPKSIDPLKRQQNWGEYSLPFSSEKLQTQGSRCMDCGTPFCSTGAFVNGNYGCPLFNHIPEWNELVAKGNWKEALHRLMMTNNFPEFTGRVCPAPCEGSCTVALHDSAVAIKSIEQAIIDKGFEGGWIIAQPPKQRTGKKVAIIGSGPAGLAAADQLNKAGHLVTVFEKADRIGGLLMYGIPNMKLEKHLIERRVDLLTQEGVSFLTNTALGTDVTLHELQSEFDAVILCTGAQEPRKLEVEGAASLGVYVAMDYLTQSTKHMLNTKEPLSISAKEKEVIVIGGGDTGADCIATALRQGCKSVVQFGKHPQLPQGRAEDNPWPEFPYVFTLDYAYEEATAKFKEDPRQYSVVTKKIVSDQQGQVKEVHTIQAHVIKKRTGEVYVQELAGTEKVWPADLIFVAIGFAGADEQWMDQLGLAHHNKLVQAEYGAYTTNIDGVFAAGDMRRGQSLIVWAIHEGREVARECDQYLMETTQLP
ncbi:glutamate synthase subunit beta [Shimazuella kribbensis]|uniref:glutamate synthase subunit beta n=1 Tax=Shimazuella kribbensis TaxID=139808 RepID=UPI000406CCC2|nr:glutamate synthase subunit beta [Shimazuella kribbensis]